MTTHLPTENGTPPVTATLPIQPAKVDPVPKEPVVDHVRSHSIKCYWDFMECRWQCSDD